jgi:preprotein translocase subunit SecA
LSREDFEGRIGLDDVVERAIDDAHHAYTEREKDLGADVLAQVERSVMLTVIDNKWREHLAEMDYLRAGIGLRAMGQRDPLTEYQREAFDTFGDLVDSVKSESVRYVYKAQVTRPESAPPARIEPDRQQSSRPVSSEKVGRNAPCPCGSGKKYKHCHGAA